MLDSYRDLIDELLGTPGRLRDLLAERETAPPAAQTLLGELLARDRVVLQRVRTIHQEANPHVRALDTTSGVAEGPVDGLLVDFDTARGNLVSLLMNLTLKDWARTATHEVEGEITLADEVERHVEFDEAHLARIEAELA